MTESILGLPEDLLPASVPRLLARDPQVPFSSDLEYFDSLVACESVRQRIFNLRVASREVFNPSRDAYGLPEAEFYENGRYFKGKLLELWQDLDSKVKETVANWPEKKPLVELFLDEMESTDNERKLFRFVLVAVSGCLRETESSDFHLE